MPSMIVLTPSRRLFSIERMEGMTSTCNDLTLTLLQLVRGKLDTRPLLQMVAEKELFQLEEKP